MKIGILLSGQPRNYNLGYQNLKYYIDNYDCDVYIHSWDADSYEATQFDMNSPKNIYQYNNVYEDIQKLYKPVSFLFEKQKIFDSTGITDPIWRQPLQSCKSMWYSVNKVFDLVDESIEYDFLIRTRFDLKYEESTLKLENLDKNKLHLWNWDTDVRVKHRGYYDVFAIGNKNNMGIYSSLYTKLNWYLNYDTEYINFLKDGWPGQDSGLRNEYLLKWHLINSGVNVEVHDTKINGADGQIIR
jgi:hypothetical protein